MDDVVTRLQETSAAYGLIGLGICGVEPFAEVRAEMERRKTSGESGRLRFTYTDPEVATDVTKTFPWAARLVVGASTYLPAAGNPGPPRENHGRVARFATFDHYDPLRRGLDAVGEILRMAGHRAEVLVDDSRLVDRAAAVRAGIAWWGKNTMVLTPRYGPWTLLGSVVTDAVLPVTVPMKRDCGMCVACIPACPTGALDEEGTIDATRCISYWAQMPGDIPLSVREVWGDRLYGCDDCLEACPPGQRWLGRAPKGVGMIDLLEVLTKTDDELLRDHSHFYTPRNDPGYLRRNALVALGHCGASEAVRTVAGYLDNHRAMLRLHAGWALGWIGGADAAAVLAEAVGRETDHVVHAELSAALAAARAASKDSGTNRRSGK